MEEKPVETKPASRKRLYAVLALIVVAIVVVGAVAVYILTLPRKYQIELWYNNDGHYGFAEDELATVLKNSIQECGNVEVTLKSDTWANYRLLRNQGRLPFFLLGWYPDYFDTDDYLAPFMGSAGSPSFGSFYSNESVDQWLVDEQTTTSVSIRTDRFNKLQDQLAADVPYIPLFSGYSEAAYVSNLQNVVLHPISFKWFIINNPASTEIRAVTVDEITSLDPAIAYDYLSIELVNQIFDTLLVYEPVNVALMPGLATEVPSVANGGISADGKTYTFHLKPNLRFSDGTALNASVVKRSIDRSFRISDAGGGAAFLLYDTGKIGRDPVTNNSRAGAIEVVGDTTIIFHLSAPVPFFNDLIAFSVAAPVPWDYDQTGAQSSQPPNVVGSGPYNLTVNNGNMQFVLENNTRYHTPNLYASFGIPRIPVEEKVTLSVLESSLALKNTLVVSPKLADVVYRTLDVEDLADLKAQATSLGIRIDTSESPFIRYLVFNYNTISDLRVRQAIAYSVDRQEIDTAVFNGEVEPLYSLVPPGFPFSEPYYKPVFQTEYGDGDCASAKALWTQLGFGASFLAENLIARDS